MTILETSQIIFNFVISFAVVMLTVLFSIIALGIIKFSKSVKKFMDGVNKESSELYEKINKFIENIFSLAFISKFFNKNKKVKLALDIFIYRIKKYIGSYTGVMSGCDAVIFTGGIGENNPELIKEICEGVISKDTRIMMIPTDEELMIARDTYRIAR